jgi:putative SOS response-associated peptidase YedK
MKINNICNQFKVRIMCGRVHCTLTPLAILKLLGLQMFLNSDLFTPRYNIGPQSYLPAVRNNNSEVKEGIEKTTVVNPEKGSDKKIVESMKWGFFNSSGLVINARIEDLHRRSMFKGIINTQRCVVPVNGYYEWKRESDVLRPFYICDKKKSTMMLGGMGINRFVQ